MSALKEANAEPIPGYRLLQPLGRGGYGEVWKCEAPGGLVKAIKFVSGLNNALDPNTGADQELRALRHVKSIRHPFLLNLERVELLEGELVIVMELADRSLADVLAEHRALGREGIPRAELLNYLLEAAEVLDLMNQENGLLHLDIKPGNLFLVGRHVKVADFGLVNSLADLQGTGAASLQLGAITPLYASPECFVGKITLFSDQYSLGITYHELLTGALPFSGKNVRQLALQHTQVEPDLTRLPEGDRPAVARALAKDPRRRFPSCTAFVEGLINPQSMVVSIPEAGRSESPPPPKKRTRGDLPLADTSANKVVTPTPPPGPTARDTEKPAVTSAPAASPLDGYRFLECLGRLPMGEMWRALAPDGRRRLVRFVTDCEAATDPTAGGPLARLRGLRHDALMPVDYVEGGPNRLALVMEDHDDTLGSRLKECLDASLPGVPREELLGYLRTAAEALDELFQAERLLHLGLNPRTLLLRQGRLLLAEFGLVELLWMPSGQEPASLNTRYAAPELFQGQLSRGSDQYSLALLFQEMLTGTHPFRNLNPRQMAVVRLKGKPDLGMLPGPDRGPISRALQLEPDDRFRTCVELVEALEQSGAATGDNVRRLTSASRRPSNGQFLSLLGQKQAAPPPPRVLPTASPRAYQAFRALVTAAGGDRKLSEFRNVRYWLGPGPVLEHQGFARLLPGTAALKLDGFRQQFGARLVQGDDHRFRFQVELAGNLLERCLGKAPGLELTIDFVRPEFATESLSTIWVRIAPQHPGSAKEARGVQEVGLVLLDGVRNYLQAHAERRGHERVPFTETLPLFPVFDEGAGDPIVAQGVNISPSGLCLRLPCRPPTEHVYLGMPEVGADEPLLLPARVVRAQPLGDGCYGLGVHVGAEESLTT